MRVLAIIPAKADSKGIPNKNIRIIGGHPLVYYAIKNAKNSSFVTDIIVSSDSPEVKTIATQMGVMVHNRSRELCGDDVTLDSVVFDVVADYENDWDYVVTLQPISPLLTAETLDNALQYAIDRELDTLISVINKPSLSWGIKDGKKVPNYSKRLNKEFLPPCFIETGAFLITKPSIIKKKTLIGDDIDVFEISPVEALSINTFVDLQSAASLMNRNKVAIYVNGNNKRGIGHIYRALEIADEFYTMPDIYYDSNQTDPKVFGTTNHVLIPVNGIAELFERCRERQYDIFINDILTTSIDYMIGLRSVLPKAKLINFEDDGEGTIKADLVFNALYNESSLPQVKAGEQYYIAGKSFMFYEPIHISEKVRRVFISFGGADPQNYTDRLLRMIIKQDYKDYSFVVVLGRAKQNVQELMQYNVYENIDVLYDVTNMPEIMSSCDIAITSRGRTGYELCMLGIPSIAMAQNQREENHGFVSNENGFTYIGLNPDDEIIESNLRMYLSMSQKSRQKFQDKLLSHNLRGGRKRVMGLINSL